MTELMRLLVEIPDVYDDFIIGVTHYASRKDEHIKLLKEYIRSNKDVMTSDVVKFIALQPDFHDYSARTKEHANNFV